MGSLFFFHSQTDTQGHTVLYQGCFFIGSGYICLSLQIKGEVYLQRMPNRWQLTAHSFRAVPSSWPALELSALEQLLWGKG